MTRRAKQAGADRPGDVMTVDQVAAYLQLNRLTVYRYVREGRIPAARIGKVYRILRADVDRFLENQKSAPTRSGRQAPVAPGETRVRTIWVRDVKKAEEIHVGPARREARRNWDTLRLSSEPLDVFIRGLN